MSRYLLGCKAHISIDVEQAKCQFKRLFRRYGLPDAIRTDNGVPFCTPGLYGLSELSLWWLRLGIRLERIRPGCPAENGRHERMHLTLQQETVRPPAKNISHQQKRFNRFQKIFNEQRPHEGINMNPPSQFYQPSKRIYPSRIPALTYPDHDWTVSVRVRGWISTGGGKKVLIGRAFKGQNLGIKEIEENLYEVSFMKYIIGYYESGQDYLTPVPNPFMLPREEE